MSDLREENDFLSRENARLQSDLDAGDAHRARYDKVAGDLGVKKEHRHDLWELSGAADKSDHDEPRLRRHLEGYLKSRPHMVDKRLLQVSRRDYADPEWRAANADKLKPGAFELTD